MKDKNIKTWPKQIPEGTYIGPVYNRGKFALQPIMKQMFNDPHWKRIAEEVKEKEGVYPKWWQKMIDEDEK